MTSKTATSKKFIASVLSISLSFSMLSATAYASEYEPGEEIKPEVYDEQNTGVGIGFILGAVVGGPVGAIAASYLGNSLGETLGEAKADKKEIAQLRNDLVQSNTEIATAREQQRQQQSRAQQQLFALQQRFVDKQLEYEQQLTAFQNQAADQKSLAVSLQFRTGSSEIEPVYQQQLLELAKTMQQMQQYGLDLSGYADRQGEEKYNQQLSLQRASNVKQFLVSQGIDASRIVTAAYGESQPLNVKQTMQSDFFDRRVMLRLKPVSAAVASN